MSEWSGRRAQQARAVVATWLPHACGRCGTEVDGTSEPWVVGHIVARSIAPELTWMVTNWQPEHRRCSDSSAQSVVIEKARQAGAAEALERAQSMRSVVNEDALFPLDSLGGQPPPRPLSPPGAPIGPSQPIDPRPGLTWAEHAIADHPWLAEFADPPPEASPPLWMSPVTPDAVCSYGWDGCTHLDDALSAVPWIEETEGKRLRWWQRLAIVRQLEHRDDGSLCHRTVLESASRRSGKSVRIRGLALWRLAHARLIGEVQTVIHTGNELPICREVQSRAWRFAERTWGSKAVTKANGKECIEATDGSRWLVRSQEGVYGWEAGLAVVDEGWDVKPDTVSEGLEPAMLERLWAQLHLTSTAHRRARSTMRSRLIDALTREDGETLLLIWAAPPGADVGDPEVWRAASPYWSADRRRMIEAKYEKALAGEADPEADDPDPMAGFTAQYLNMWRLTGKIEPPGTPLVTPDDWYQQVALPDPERTPDAAAIESWFSHGVTLALAWRDDQAAIVTASDHRDPAAAVAAMKRAGYRGRVIVGASLADDPALKRTPTTPTRARAGAAAADLARLLSAGHLHHDGTDHLTNQVLEVRTRPGSDGPRVVSKGRADAVKAAAWAAVAARAQRSARGGIVLPSGV